MAIQVMIKRRVHQGRQAKELVPLLLRMRALAIFQTGYISSETWCDIAAIIYTSETAKKLWFSNSNLYLYAFTGFADLIDDLSQLKGNGSSAT